MLLWGRPTRAARLYPVCGRRSFPRYTANLCAPARYCSSRRQPAPSIRLVKGCAVGALALLARRSRGVRRDAGVLALGLAFSTGGRRPAGPPCAPVRLRVGRLPVGASAIYLPVHAQLDRWNPAGPAAPCNRTPDSGLQRGPIAVDRPFGRRRGAPCSRTRHATNNDGLPHG